MERILRLNIDLPVRPIPLTPQAHRQQLIVHISCQHGSTVNMDSIQFIISISFVQVIVCPGILGVAVTLSMVLSRKSGPPFLPLNTPFPALPNPQYPACWLV